MATESHRSYSLTPNFRFPFENYFENLKLSVTKFFCCITSFYKVLFHAQFTLQY